MYEGDTFTGATLGESAIYQQGAAPTVPCFTLAFHPNISRIGEQLRAPKLLLGTPLNIARLDGGWSSAEDSGERPLNDPFLSRKPVIFSASPAGISVDVRQTSTRVRVDGEPVAGVDVIEHTRCTAGVTIELGNRVVLVLKYGFPDPCPRSEFDLLGVSPEMALLRREIARVAPENIPVLLRGLSGSGKELVAQALHRQSDRRNEHFIAVNMGAIPEPTASSELFGHVKGAFTGANTTKAGYFGEADRGTLFLDEIGETPVGVQPVMLRALENGEIQPLGSQRSRRVDVRIIAATDADLDNAIANDRFRLALLHRLAGYEVQIAPLNQRREDIGLLFMHFFRREMVRLGMEGHLQPDYSTQVQWFPARLMADIVRADWRGNVRQLRNIARQLAIASKGASKVTVNRTVADLLHGSKSSEVTVPPASVPTTKSKRANLDQIRDEDVVSALRQNHWKIAASARAIGVSKNSLYQLMERSQLIRKARDLSRSEIEAAADNCAGQVAQMAAYLEVSQRGLKLRMTALGFD
ncbi:MAG: sigma 54-interacting transcriptional regulator [Myxococcota bacterium]|nr:sigma 54-interacting transcriptional regulator [Myxococcota bacterium]